MCTKPRIIVPAVFYHVYSKGVFGEDIFPTEELKTFFLKELAITLKKFSFTCCSWSLQKDHYHLVIESSEIPISKFMQRLNSVYAKKFNRERGREGVVFFRRYASIITEETELRKLIRYVHLNPVRCGVCTLEDLDQYQWCGHRSVIQEGKDEILNRNSLLDQFPGPDPFGQYRDYLSSGNPNCENDETIRKVRDANKGKMSVFKPECWVIGSPDFVRKVLELDRCRRARVPRHFTFNTPLEKIHGALQLCFFVRRRNCFTRAGSIRNRHPVSSSHIWESAVMISMPLKSPAIWELPDQESPEWFQDMHKLPSRSTW